MGARAYGVLATVALISMFWMFDYIQQPGTQWFGSLAFGALGAVTVWALGELGAARAAEYQRRAREEVRDGR